MLDRKTLQIAAGAAILIGGAGFGIGYSVAPREILDEKVEANGLFSKDITRTLSAAVASLKAENKLVVYSYYGVAEVEAEKVRLGGLVNGKQELTVRANIPYYIDMAEFSESNVNFDEKHKLVTIKIPKLKLGEIAFQSELAKVDNEGLMTISDEVVQDLMRKNYAQARKTFIKQAQDATLIEQARQQASKDIVAYFNLAFSIAGQKEILVQASFS